MFPRCGIPDIFGTWAEQRRYFELLFATDCIQEFTQVWWSVRPHHSYGTVEVRICDVQTEPWQTLAVHSLALGLVATLAGMVDEGRPLPVRETRWIEENLWRAIRYGLDGKLVDWDRGVEVAAPEALRGLVEWVRPAGEKLALTPYLDDVERLLTEGNGAQRQGRAAGRGALHPRSARRCGRAGQRDPRATTGGDGPMTDDERAARERASADRPGARRPVPRAAQGAARGRPGARHDGDPGHRGLREAGLTEQTRELRDLRDARVAIESLRRLIEVVEAEGDPDIASLRSTLAQMQLNFARASAEPRPAGRARRTSAAEPAPLQVARERLDRAGGGENRPQRHHPRLSTRAAGRG